ncbi:uncharacterized protein CIMG_10891 [Coccidioides immitis RS]|uniref:Uncharacterized protein n=1 Tax=Coccidioides immitis (strain RS) TaxID=246410 RepID=A0A0D8JSC9_COCIM|nr:uncharacterized protein CIMG_10891 [Coccidioides immitis RS]KJF60049.1 hypothetical protein CIMG_10891 [Coccidioides immitis RS]
MGQGLQAAASLFSDLSCIAVAQRRNFSLDPWLALLRSICRISEGKGKKKEKEKRLGYVFEADTPCPGNHTYGLLAGLPTGHRIFVSTRLHLPILICSLTNAIPMDGSEYRAISITWDCCPICAQEQRRLGLTPKRFTCRTAFPWNLEDRLYQYSPADFIDV